MSLRTDRLKKKKDFERVFKRGIRFKEDFLILKTVKNDLDETRFGFVVSRKVSPKAIVRNKIRRRLKELVRRAVTKGQEEDLSSSPRAKAKMTKKGTDNLFVVLPGLEKKDFWEVENVVAKLFKKAGIIKK